MKDHSAYESSPIAVAVRDLVRALILAGILWSVHTLNSIDKDTNTLKWRMERIEKRVGQLEQQERVRRYNNETFIDD